MMPDQQISHWIGQSVGSGARAGVERTGSKPCQPRPPPRHRSHNPGSPAALAGRPAPDHGRPTGEPPPDRPTGHPGPPFPAPPSPRRHRSAPSSRRPPPRSRPPRGIRRPIVRHQDPDHRGTPWGSRTSPRSSRCLLHRQAGRDPEAPSANRGRRAAPWPGWPRRCRPPPPPAGRRGPTARRCAALASGRPVRASLHRTAQPPRPRRPGGRPVASTWTGAPLWS
jgi:hypothetical protein